MDFWRTVLRPSTPLAPELPKKPVIEYPKVDVTKYIKSSINDIPVVKKDSDIYHCPLTMAVTPLIHNPEKIPVSEYPLDEALKCSNCGTICNTKSVLFQEDKNFLCNICKTKNELGVNTENQVKSVQFHVNMVEYPFHDTTLPNSPVKNILLLEKSELTVNHGLFAKTVDKLIKKINTLKSGYFSIFLLNKSLTIPKISDDRTKFSYSSYPDISEIILPGQDSIFFNIAEEKELLIKYIQYIAEFDQGTCANGLFEIIDSVAASYAGQNVMTTIVASTLKLGTMEEAKQLGHKLLLSLSHFDLFIMNPSIDSPPNFESVGEFSMLNNSHLSVFNAIQVEMISDDIIYRTFVQKCPAALVTVSHPAFLNIKDIKGCGMRRTLNSFIMTVAEPGDTIFFMYEHANEKVDFTFPSLTYQMRIIKEDGSAVVQVATYGLNIVDNALTVFKNANIGVFLQHYIIQAIEDGRELSDELVMLSSLDKIIKDVMESNMVKLMLGATGEGEYINNFKLAKVLFGAAQRLLNFVRASEILSRTPEEFLMFVAPMCYQLQQDTREVPKRVYLNNLHPKSGAMFIQYDDRHSIILLHESEDINEWLKYLNEPPLRVVLKEITHTPCIEILHPVVNATSRIYNTINKCMTAQALQ